MSTRRTLRTPEEIAAFKAANRAAAPAVHVIRRERRPAPRSQRAEFLALAHETEGMIRAARRQGLFDALPALLARHTQLLQLASSACLS